MPLKQEIVAELGETELLQPERIARSLVANDQVKYYFALLQTARSNADQPRVPVFDLKAERLASQISDEFLDEVVADTRKEQGGSYRLPHAAEILSRIKSGMEDMFACLPAAERRTFVERLGQCKLPEIKKDALTGEQIDAMTSGDRSVGDSLHLVVIDAHRAINHLQAATATETLAGAHVHALSPGSRRLVLAFMEGLNRTAPLKFNHPGLGTTATEHAGRVLIQNDIGTTDAHVLVVRIDNLTTALTYTDIHRPRLKFFQSLFSDFEVAWEGMEQRTSGKLQSGTYLLTTGTYHAADQQDLERYLSHLGSRIVFLIDWNRMRKRLRGFIGKERAIEVLKWAADNDHGHRGLLEIGGEGALAEAVEYAAGERLRYGDRLDALIGEANTKEFLCHAMRSASAGLVERRSRRAILDEIKAELSRYFENAGLAIFDIAARHAACGYDIAVTIREAFERIGGNGHEAWTAKFSARAIAWEARADQLLNEARDDIKRFGRPASLLDFLEYADDAVDEIEEAASLVDLLGLVSVESAALRELRRLADVTLGSAQEFVKCVECAATITRTDVRDDLDDFLHALERLIGLEHEADELIRTLRRHLIAGAEDHRALYLVHQLSFALETATDAYAHAGQALRGYLMEEVIA
ncbi:MAG: DUF47 family protein [Hyphomicrobium sp.]|jgi:uncharacterized protein Yka (UPF0111/DUF47 family)